jgi:hypothetical protein
MFGLFKDNLSIKTSRLISINKEYRSTEEIMGETADSIALESFRINRVTQNHLKLMKLIITVAT